LHDVGGDDPQDQTEGGTALGADGAEQVDRGVALVLSAGGSRTALKPSSTIPAGQSGVCGV